MSHPVGAAPSRGDLKAIASKRSCRAVGSVAGRGDRAHSTGGRGSRRHDFYFGIQTARGKDNFRITGIPVSHEPTFVQALGYVKKAAMLANRDLGVLEPQIADAIAVACDRLTAGELVDQFALPGATSCAAGPHGGVG